MGDPGSEPQLTLSTPRERPSVSAIAGPRLSVAETGHGQLSVPVSPTTVRRPTQPSINPGSTASRRLTQPVIGYNQHQESPALARRPTQPAIGGWPTERPALSRRPTQAQINWPLQSPTLSRRPTQATIAIPQDWEPQADESGLEPIAIVGIGCKFPGGVTNPQELWANLAAGHSAWSKGPGDRYNLEAFQNSEDPSATETNAGGGHFLDEDISTFDATFFGINALEAKAMDPQQRILLEVAYEAFENAGMTPDSLWGSNTGVYVGQWTCDYAENLSRDPEFPATYQTTGAGPAITSNRVSYHFNLTGPSMTVDTGCSASFVALHLAIQSLRARETTMGFVGGVNILCDPQRFMYQSKLKMFSKDGRSFCFDERANGYGRGEGCSGIVLKPLSDALRDGDTVRAVIRNSVINQDGRTSGLTVPSETAQERAIRKAYSQVGLPLKADYVEAHGTGTAVGDPIETHAIASVLTADRTMTDRLPIGSIKGNIGHTESTAGLAGLIKSVLMLEHNAIPPQVNFQTPNKRILFDDWNLYVPTRLENRELNRISVNSFGYGGTNAHIILDSAQEHTPLVSAIAASPRFPFSPVTPVQASRPRAFLVSGGSEYSCQTMASRLAHYLSTDVHTTHETQLLDRLAITLMGRALHKYQRVVLASSTDELAAKLRVISQKPIATGGSQRNERLGFVFGGQGAQYFNMARELIDTWPIFTESLKRANSQLVALGADWDLLRELQRSADASRIDEPALGQPASTAIQLALIDTLAALGAYAQVVTGHSSGEIAAAYCAGLLTFEDAMKVSYHRGRLTSEMLKGGDGQKAVDGAMLAVGASGTTVNSYLAKMRAQDASRVCIACYNSPSSVTMSGDKDAVEKLAKLLETDSVFNRVLRTNGAAYHSPQMRRIADQYAAQLEGIESPRSSPMSGAIMLSTANGGTVVRKGDMGGAYWVRNLVSPVYFDQSVKQMCDARNGVGTIVELGAHAVLEGPVKQTLQTVPGSSDIQYISTLRRKANAAEELLGTVAKLYCSGVNVDFELANSGFSAEPQALARLTDVPPYAFDNRQSYWHESRVSRAFRHPRYPPHELLGSQGTEDNAFEPRWRRFLGLKDVPWLKGHVAQSEVVFPAVAFLSMAAEAARRHRELDDGAVYQFHNVHFGKALVLHQDMANDHEICVSMRPEVRSAKNSSESWLDFRIFTVTDQRGWTEHCRGLVSAVPQENAGTLEGAGIITGHALQNVTPSKFYYLSREIGLEWTEPFNNVTSMQIGDESCQYTVKAPEIVKSIQSGWRKYYGMHPGLFDAALFHGACAVEILSHGRKSAVVPTFIEHLTLDPTQSLTQPNSQLNCVSVYRPETQTYDVVIKASDYHGRVETIVGELRGVTLTQLPADTSTMAASRELCHTPGWVTYYDTLRPADIADLALAADTVDAPKSMASLNQRLNASTVAYIRKAIEELPIEELMDDYRQNQFAWMQHLVENSDWDDDVDSEDEGNAAETEGVVAKAVKAIGSNLTSLLAGEREPLAVLSEDNVLQTIYSDPRCQRCYAQIGAYCTKLAQQKPGLKMLEVGAGTAAAAEPLLGALFATDSNLISQYDFTDLSPGFFDAARAKLSDYSSATRFQTLDVEKNPEEQGFEAGTYDIVLACNIVHATPSIDTTLKNIKKLLRPDGVFIMMELTKDEPFYNLIFGSLPGWWAGVGEGRIMSPLLDVPAWTEKLKESGFNAPIADLVDYEESEGGTISVLISKPAQAASEGPSDKMAIELISCLGADPQIPQLHKRLSSKHGIDSIHKVDLYDPTKPTGITVLPPEVCDALIGQDISKTAWESFKMRLLNSKAVLMLTRGATISCERPLGGAVAGFVSTFRREHPDIRMVTLDLSTKTDGQGGANAVARVLESPSFDLSKDVSEIDGDFAERQGRLFVSRYFPADQMDDYVRDACGQAEPTLGPFIDTDRSLTAKFGVPGVLDSLHWIDNDQALLPLDPDHIELELRAASINFKDVLIAANQLAGISEMRNDCSGVVKAVGANMKDRFKEGDHVCCFYSRSYANRPRVHGDCCAVVPESMPFDVAASLPIVWGTVYHSLVTKGQLRKGESVLIHSAAGAVGQAAVALAHSLGAEVFATVSSKAKREYLTSKCGVRPDHIFSSRDTSFGAAIRKMTPREGVDVVLNSLGGDMFRETCNTLAHGGRFVEIGRKDFLEDMLMPSKFLLKNITFAYVDLALLIDVEKPLVRELLKNVVGLMASGSVKPTGITKMPISELTAAFRTIQAGKHMGKIILEVEEGQEVKVSPPPPSRAGLRSDGSYLIVGGLGGLGKSIIRWMADRGARSIIAMSRSGKVDTDGQALIDELAESGVRLQCMNCDIGSQEDLRVAIDSCHTSKSTGPLRGVIHSAMVIQDAFFENMNYSQWATTLRPKVAGSWNLHQTLPKDIDFFVMLSSTVAISGNPGQCHYGAGCSFKNSLARYRRGLGLPGYSINVGAVSDVGFVSEHPEVAEALRRNGLGTITEAQFLSHLEYVIAGIEPERCESSVGLTPAGDERGLRDSNWVKDSKFRHLARRNGGFAGGDGQGSDSNAIAAIGAATSIVEAGDLIADIILEQLSKLIMMPVDRLSTSASLEEYGVDSLVAVELKNWFSAYLHANIPMLTIRSSPSIRELATAVARESRVVNVEE